MSHRTTGLLLALTSAATFGTSGSLASSLLDAGWSPGAVVLARVSLGAALLAVPTAVALRRLAARDGLGALRSSSWVTVVYGVFAVALAQVGFFNAVSRVPVSVALLLEYLGITLVVAWMWLRHRQRPRRLMVAGSVVVLVGLAFVLDLFGGAHFDLIGVLWGLGAAVGLATYYVLSARSQDALPPVATAGLGMAVGAIALVGLGAIDVVPVHARFGAVPFAGHHVAWWVPVVALALVAAAVAYVAGIYAAMRLGPKLASFVGLTEVLFAVLFAWGLLGQLPTWGQGFGGVLIIAGIVLVKADDTASAPRQEAAPAPEFGTLDPTGDAAALGVLDAATGEGVPVPAG